jgi:hypothetical protein
MTDRPTTDQDPAADAVGRRIREAALAIDAPPALRERVAEQRREAAAAATARRARWTGWRLPTVAVGAVAALALVLVVSGVLGGNGTTGPSFDDAAKLALARPTAPAPAEDPQHERLVDVKVGDVQFPNYTYDWPQWKTVGTRHDTVNGRAMVTVSYHGPKGTVGYTIVAGRPLGEPSDARQITVGGRRLAVLRRDGTTYVMWRRGGHTCVLASRATDVQPDLVRFATWA